MTYLLRGAAAIVQYSPLLVVLHRPFSRRIMVTPTGLGTYQRFCPPLLPPQFQDKLSRIAKYRGAAPITRVPVPAVPGTRAVQNPLRSFVRER